MIEYVFNQDCSIVVLQDDRSLRKCLVIETPAEKLMMAEEVMVPTFRNTPRDPGKRHEELEEEGEDTDDEAYDKRHKRTEMQEKKVRNREKERYLHELHKLHEAVERQKQQDINERLWHKKKPDFMRSSLSPEPSPQPVPKLKLKLFAPSQSSEIRNPKKKSGSQLRVSARPGSSGSVSLLPKPHVPLAKLTPLDTRKNVMDDGKNISSFGTQVPEMQRADFTLPEFYFSY